MENMIYYRDAFAFVYREPFYIAGFWIMDDYGNAVLAPAFFDSDDWSVF